MTNPASEKPDSQVILNQAVLEFMKERRYRRYWRWFMRLVILLLVIAALYHLVTYKTEEKLARLKPHVGLIDVSGSIFDAQGSSSENFAKSLSEAYKNGNLKALILRINSPGGSPVQADYMYNSLRYYRGKYPDIKIYAVCVDMCASAAYYVAAAADEIYANPSSMVGSIGVLYNGFGFVEAMHKLGITRRLHTAGNNKGFLDPFSPTTPGQEQALQLMLNDVHQQFIDKVKQGRGERLKIDDLTFSGLFWTGEQAKARGLIDGFASSGQLAREVIQNEHIIDYTRQPTVFERMAKNIGTAMVDQLPLAMGVQPGLKI